MCQLAQFPSMMDGLTYSVLETRSMLADSVFKESIPQYSYQAVLLSVRGKTA